MEEVLGVKEKGSILGEGGRLSGNVDEGKGGLIESAAEVGNDEESAGQKKSERKRKKKD